MSNNGVRPNSSENNSEAYSVREIAEIMGIKLRSAYTFCETTTDFRIKRIGRTIRINKKSFDEWWNS